MSKQTASKIEATAALVSALATAIAAAKQAGLDASEISRAIEPITELLSNDES